MTPAQLALFTVVLVIWIALAFGIFPWLQGRRLRTDFRFIGYGVLLLLLLVSLFTAPSLVLWLEYMSIAVLVLLALLAYNHWVLKTEAA